MRAATAMMGKLIRLIPPEPEKDGRISMIWHQDSELKRLADTEPVRHFTYKQERDFHEKGLTEFQSFMIWTIADDRLIGNISLDEIDWCSGNAWLGVWIGEREYWGRGFGSDAMQVMLQYAFMEMNLRRISLTVFAYNPRAVHVYKKLGFQVEGCERMWLHRAGKRADLIYMGLLRREWKR
jgi:RimJ/RimL family protein N-acetyltransferase